MRQAQDLSAKECVALLAVQDAKRIGHNGGPELEPFGLRAAQVPACCTGELVWTCALGVSQAEGPWWSSACNCPARPAKITGRGVQPQCSGTRGRGTRQMQCMQTQTP